jgi:hypothetical protein
MSTILNYASNVHCRSTFVEFVRKLREDLDLNPSDWENASLSDYLDAIANWSEDMDGYYSNTGRKCPTDVNWKFLVDVMMAARIYE